MYPEICYTFPHSSFPFPFSSNNYTRIKRFTFPFEMKGKRRKKFCRINDTLKRVLAILVNWHISTVILTSIARATLVNIPVEMWQFTRIPMSCFKVSFMLQNFSRWRIPGNQNWNFYTNSCWGANASRHQEPS